MGEAADLIVAEITDARHAIDRDLDALQRRVRQETRNALQPRRHPWIVAGLAGAAVLLGLLIVKLVRD